MEITDRTLYELGIKPQIYPPREREKISAYAEKIADGRLSELISQITPSGQPFCEVKKAFYLLLDKMYNAALEVSAETELMASAVSKTSGLFSFSISESEKTRALTSVSRSIQRVYNIRNLVLNDLISLYVQLERLLMIQNKLVIYASELEMIKIAADILKTHSDTEYDLSFLSSSISEAHSEMRHAAELEKKVLSLSSLYEETFEKTLYQLLNGIADASDLVGNGEKMTPSNIVDAASRIKSTLNNLMRAQGEIL